MKKFYALICGLVASAAIIALGSSSEWYPVSAADKVCESADKPAVKRARKTVRMLDEIYKQTIILITDKYIHDEDDYPAGSAAVALFAKISKSGSHKVRLIDATGEPYERENVAKDAFEREGIKRLKAGAKQYERIVREDGKPQLRVVTPVPVVSKKCVMCHEHYGDVKDGQPIGAISYTMPIE